MSTDTERIGIMQDIPLTVAEVTLWATHVRPQYKRPLLARPSAGADRDAGMTKGGRSL